MHEAGRKGHVEAQPAQFPDLPENPARRPVHGQAPPVQHDYPPGPAGRFLHVVGHQHHRGALPAPELFDAVHQLPPAPRVQAGRGLVQDQHLRPHGQHARNGHPPLHAVAQGKGGQPAHRLRVQAGQAQRLRRPLPGLVPAQSQVFQAEGHFRENRFFENLLLGLLENQPYLAPYFPAGLLFGKVGAADPHLSRGGSQGAVEVLDQGGLPGARGPDHCNELAPGNFQGNAVQGDNLEWSTGGVNVGEVFRFNYRLYEHTYDTRSRAARMPSGTKKPRFLKPRAILAAPGISRPSSSSSSAFANTFGAVPSRTTLPPDITMILSARAASSIKWVTRTTVTPSSRFSLQRVSMSSRRPAGSSMAPGSSRTRQEGRMASTPAMASRCFCPPERRWGACFR
ncbi:hypothetical protein PTH_0353 [Pelotomaculum thermopropionicum SI]|uniref:Uncharacterized protein n=1 Tax=Pelotomaculum thermopropionicum (strain DSM 13744 / JCM 10971 / SI) TaxID=370438 RepID=A5D5F2_PELTS|nr:hypothetical protein PTH_0353 [Pelotomaculum thermopropionicum SI]